MIRQNEYDHTQNEVEKSNSMYSCVICLLVVGIIVGIAIILFL